MSSIHERRAQAADPGRLTPRPQAGSVRLTAGRLLVRAAGPGGAGGEGGGRNEGGIPADERETDLATRSRKKSARPDRYKVLLYNDDYTPMDFVVAILVQVFDKSPAAATQIMLAVHNAGMGVAGVYVLELAETKVAKVHKLAEERGYPLRCGVEKE